MTICESLLSVGSGPRPEPGTQLVDFGLVRLSVALDAEAATAVGRAHPTLGVSQISQIMQAKSVPLTYVVSLV
jgi:hypothetical protein